ncbi:MAG: CHAD domain-containing protein [Gammaproteobacteria bacterium]|nr:CHAD domain-containing protein [Gammaproteobacteria bacterium]
MNKHNNIHFILDGNMQNNSMGEKLGKFTLKYQSTEDTAPFELLDCFDQSIRKSGQVLIFSKNKLMLLQQDGAILSQTVDEASVFITDLKDGPVKTVLGFVPPLRRILPVGLGTLSHQLVKAVDDETKTHTRVHLQTFQAKNVDTQVTFATLQGLRGYQKAFDLMRQKVEQLGYKKEQDISSIYARLIAEYQPYNPKPVIVISKDEQAFQAANDIINAYIEVARLNEPGILADRDTEFLHDYRVSLRKVRSVLSLFKGIYSDEQTQTLKQAFADLMSPTGRLRDLDVYLLDRQHYFELLPESLHDGLTIMFDLFAVERNDQLKKISAHLKSPAYKNKINSLATLFSESDALQAGANTNHSAYLYASMLIWKRYRKVCKIARAITPTTDDSEVHDLRIHCKKLRYLMEFFSPMYPARKIKGLIKALKLLQDNLGLFNDYSVQQDSLQAFILNHASKGQKQDLIVAKSVGALIAMLYQKQLEERARVISNFEIFDSQTIQQQFRGLFKND